MLSTFYPRSSGRGHLTFFLQKPFHIAKISFKLKRFWDSKKEYIEVWNSTVMLKIIIHKGLKYLLKKIFLHFFTHEAIFWFSNFSCSSKSQIFFSSLNFNCSIFWDLRNLQEHVKKAFCYQKLFWPFTVWVNYSSDLEIFQNSRPSALNFKSFSWLLEHFFSQQVRTILVTKYH